jgi:hypothetical protein
MQQMQVAETPTDVNGTISDFDLYMQNLRAAQPNPFMLDPRFAAAEGGVARQAYGLGSLVRKITRPIKKILKSDVGKAALLYGLGTYLGGTTAFGGSGKLSAFQRFKDPKLLKNLTSPQFLTSGETTSALSTVTPTTGVDAVTAPFGRLNLEAATAAAEAVKPTPTLIDKAVTYAIEKPVPTIFGLSSLAGLSAAGEEDESLDGITSREDDSGLKELIARYPELRFQVQPQYQLAANGGRIGYKDAGSVLKGQRRDPYEIIAEMDNELNPGIMGKIPFFTPGKKLLPLDEDQGASLIKEIQDYKYGESYPNETIGVRKKGVFNVIPKPDRLPMSMEQTISTMEAEWDKAIEEGHRPGRGGKFDDLGIYSKEDIRRRVELGFDQARGPEIQKRNMRAANGGRIGYEEGGNINPADLPMSREGLPTYEDIETGEEVEYPYKNKEMSSAPDIDAELFQMYLDAIGSGKIPRSTTFDQYKELMGETASMGPERTMANEGGLMSLGGNEMDLRGGGFVPLGAREKADDVPARLSKNEFVFTADAVKAAGGGDVDRGANLMYKTMKNLESRVG